jgi:hypothetical protein
MPKKTIYYCLIILLSLTTWHQVLNLTLEGEAHIYFNSSYQFYLTPSKENLNTIIGNYDNFGRIVYTAFGPLFKVNPFPYMLLLLITIISVNLAFFIFLKAVFKNNMAAFFSTIYAGTSFKSSFQFYARGHYHWFVQRVPETTFIFLSLYFLIIFLQSNKLHHYIFSVAIYTLALFIARFGIQFCPFIIFTITFKLLSHGINRKNIQTAILISLPFLLISFFLLQKTSQETGITQGAIHANRISELLQNTKQVANSISFQLIAISVPFEHIREMSKSAGNLVNLQNIIPHFYPHIYFAYAIALAFLIFKKSKLIFLAVSSFMALIVSLFMTVFFGRSVITADIYNGRYFYIPNFFFAIFLGILLIEILNIPRLKPASQKLLILIISLKIFSANATQVNNAINQRLYYFTANKLMYRFLDQNINNFKKDSVILLPTPPMPYFDAVQRFYRYPEITYFPLEEKSLNNIKGQYDINNIYAYDYSDEYKKGGKADIKKISVIDVTDKYRQELSQTE